MVEWAHRFDCPIHLHAADAEWVMRPDPAIRHWEGDALELGHGLTLVRGGGHFPGGAMLHRAAGAGELLTGDIIQVIPDLSHVGFMWSYPNLVPLPEAEVQAIAAAVEPFEFDTIYGAWWGRIVPSGAKDVVHALGRALRARAARRAARDQLDSSTSNVMPCAAQALDQRVAHRDRGGDLAGARRQVVGRPGRAPTRRASSPSRRSPGRRRPPRSPRAGRRPRRRSGP